MLKGTRADDPSTGFVRQQPESVKTVLRRWPPSLWPVC